jgi:hypothetical protein
MNRARVCGGEAWKLSLLWPTLCALWWDYLCVDGSAMVAGAVTNPVDLIKVRVQTSSLGAVECVKNVIREGGLRALFRGTGARVLWIGPNMMLTLSIYDLLMENKRILMSKYAFTS